MLRLLMLHGQAFVVLALNWGYLAGVCGASDFYSGAVLGGVFYKEP